MTAGIRLALLAVLLLLIVSAPAAADGATAAPTTAGGDVLSLAPATQPASADDPADVAAAQNMAELTKVPPTLGYSGRLLSPASRPPASAMGGGDFLPLPDRWRIGVPADYQGHNQRGNIYDPYNQNVLKGDYPVLLQKDYSFLESDLFFVADATSDTLFEARKLPLPSGTSTAQAGRFDFFGGGKQFMAEQNFVLTLEMFEGDAGYKPRDLDVRVTPVFNLNYVNVEELQAVNPDPRAGRDRTDGFVGFQEAFIEKRLPITSPNFDFVSVRAGIQGFNSDFRGFLFSDNEPGIRLFGTYDNNRFQYNLAWFHALEKDTNSGLNSYTLRHQDVFIANLYRQDFLFPGYTAQLSFHTNLDEGGGVKLDQNGVIVRPQPIGTIHDKSVHAYYLGWAGDGHIGRINVSHQFYQVFGEETYDAIAGQHQDINAQFFSIAASYDQDYIRYRSSFAYASGDSNPTDGKANGFDSIFDNPNFAGGGTNFFTRQAIPLTGTGVNLVNRNSFLPDLRTSKEEGQANFVNPGLLLYNVGMDVDVTPKLTLITNASYLQFADTQSLKLLLQDDKISSGIGFDLSAALQYRPFLNNNAIVTFGAAALVPTQGFKDIYTSQTLYSIFTSATFSF